MLALDVAEQLRVGLGRVDEGVISGVDSGLEPVVWAVGAVMDTIGDDEGVEVV